MGRRDSRHRSIAVELASCAGCGGGPFRTIRRVNQGLFWRSLLAQGLVVGALFGLLLLLPLDEDFFKDYGFAVGPAAWAGCALVTARLLSLPLGLALFAALAGGVAGALVGLVAGHEGGLVVALLVFAASCGGYDAERDTAPV